MTMQIFNAITANLRKQFPTLSEAMLLQKTTEIYQAMLNASLEAAKLKSVQGQVQLTNEDEQPEQKFFLFSSRSEASDRASQKRQALTRKLQQRRGNRE